MRMPHLALLGPPAPLDLAEGVLAVSPLGARSVVLDVRSNEAQGLWLMCVVSANGAEQAPMTQDPTESSLSSTVSL